MASLIHGQRERFSKRYQSLETQSAQKIQIGNKIHLFSFEDSEEQIHVYNGDEKALISPNENFMEIRNSWNEIDRIMAESFHKLFLETILTF